MGNNIYGKLLMSILVAGINNRIKIEKENAIEIIVTNKYNYTI